MIIATPGMEAMAVAVVSEWARREALRLLAEEGCSAREAARRVGCAVSSVSRWASLAGMQLRSKTMVGGLEVSWSELVVDPVPARKTPVGQMPRRVVRLGLTDRVRIGCRLEQRWSLRAIAVEVGVAASTVSREVARGSRFGRYDPGWAHRQTMVRRARPRVGKLGPGTVLRGLVVARLNHRCSPQQVAARLRRDFPGREDLQVSHETIYQALYVQGRGSLREELATVKALRSGRTRRRSRSLLPPAPGRPWLVGAHLSRRPAEATDRAVPGHWEGDLVMGAGGRTALITLVERATRFALISRLPLTHTSPVVIDRLTAMITTLPAQLRRSLTWDQGSEMADHARFSLATDCPVFFCDPHSPWQRGSNENLNGLIRDFYPKGTNFATITDHQISDMQHLLNARPRMTLDWDTPAERLNHLITVATTT